jgi:ADP-ribosylglycohydrolase
MYVAPVGVVNAADPAGAYVEAIEIASAHQSSYGREAAGVMAAAVAAAHSEGATPRSVVDDVLALARDGTRDAIAAVAEVAETVHDWREAIPLLRKAVEPFDTVGPEYRAPAMDARRPSRTKSIEELPVALGMVLVADGDYEAAVLGGVNYGRDADSIASMAGAVCGALGGLGAVRSDWATEVAEASRTPLEPAGRTIADVAREVFARDVERDRLREQRRAGLLAT